MLKLGQKKEPQRIVLRAAQGGEPEAFIVMAPITPAMRRRAQTAVRRLLSEVDHIDEIDVDTLGDVAETVSRELVRLGAIEWGGIGGGDDEPIELTPDRETRLKTANDPNRPTGTIDLLLEDEEIFERLDTEYIVPDARRRAEKNGSSASPTGTGEAGTPANGTASSPAAAKRRRTASRKAGAKNAPTPRTRSKAKKPKTSGRS